MPLVLKIVQQMVEWMNSTYWSLCHRKLHIDLMVLDAGASILNVLGSLHTSREETNDYFFILSLSNVYPYTVFVRETN